MVDQPYHVQIKQDRTRMGTVYMAYDIRYPGCMAQGDDPIDALRNLDEARGCYLEALEYRLVPVTNTKGDK